jgi:PKD repeat protein
MDRASDASSEPDAIAPLVWVDLAVTGCDIATAGAAIDAGSIDTAACQGPAPLELSFVAVAPASITVHAWSFGDGDTSGDISPGHVYAAPGLYDVSLSVLGPGGNASTIRKAFIGVRPAPLGRRCTADAQCESGDCVGADGDVPPGLRPGFCSETCGVVAPCDSGVCANLAPAPVGSPQDWQRSLCLIDCSAGGQCPGGFVCRELRAGIGNGWVRGCFAAALLGDVGASCTDEVGNLVHSACAGGLCLDEGARGMCSAPCGASACPPSAACATFLGGNPAPSCLARCDTNTPCDDDPWLACEDAGGTGAKAFTVSEPASAAGYCAPERCTGDAECGPDGRCASGFCAPAL